MEELRAAHAAEIAALKSEHENERDRLTGDVKLLQFRLRHADTLSLAMRADKETHNELIRCTNALRCARGVCKILAEEFCAIAKRHDEPYENRIHTHVAMLRAHGVLPPLPPSHKCGASPR